MSTKTTIPQQSEGLCTSFSQLSLVGAARTVPIVKSYKEAALARSVIKENRALLNPSAGPKSFVSQKQHIASLLETLKSQDLQTEALSQLQTFLLSPQRTPLHDITNVAGIRNPDRSARAVLPSQKARYLREAFVANLRDLATQTYFEPIRLLLQGLLVDKSISIEEAYTLSAQLLLLHGERFDISSLDSLSKDSRLKFTACLQTAYQNCVRKIELLDSIGVYRYSDLACTLLPVEIAALVLLPSGRVNVGILPLVVQVFLPAPNERDGVHTHIARMAQELASDPGVINLIETIPAIAGNTLGHRLVNATLLRSQKERVQAADARCATIAAALTFWRQYDAVNCCPNSLLSQRQGMGLRWFVEDIKSLLTQGCIRRTAHDREIRFIGAEASEPAALDLPVADMTSITSSWVVRMLAEQLQISRQHLDTVLRENPSSLRQLLSTLHTRWPQSYPSEAVTYAQFLIESPIRCSLLSVLENGIGSSYSAPLSTEFGTSTSLQWDMYKIALLIFRELAAKYNLVGIGNKVDIAQQSLVSGTLPTNYCGVLLLQLKKYRLDWKVSQKLCATACTPGVVQISLEEDSGFTPIKRIEFAVRLYAAFTSLYVEVYGKTTIPDSINVNLIDTELAKQHFFEDGSREEQGMPNFLRSMGMQHENAKILKCTAQSAKSFLLWLRRFRIGNDPNLSLLGASAHHQFRFLPNHPSLSSIDPLAPNDSLALLQRRYHEFGMTSLQSLGDKKIVLDILADITSWLIAEAGQRISFRNFPGLTIRLPEAVASKIRDQVVDHINRDYQTLTVSSVNLAIQEMILTKIIDYVSMDTARFATMRRNELIDNCRLILAFEERYYHVFMGLLETQPRLHHLLLHFADSNYTAEIAQKQYALHTCLWFSQLSNRWTVVSATENVCWHPMIRLLDTPFNEFGMVDSLDDIQKEVERRREMGYAS